MARCTAPSRGHRSAAAAANCPACSGRYSRYGSVGYSSYSPHLILRLVLAAEQAAVNNQVGLNQALLYLIRPLKFSLLHQYVKL